GIIGKIQVDRGNLVGKGEPTLLTTVSAVDPIFADFSITDAELLYFSDQIRAATRGQATRPTRGTLELVLSDGSVFPQKGRPIFVDRAVDPKTGTIGVRAEFPNPQKVLRPGQFARVRAVVEELSNAVLVPQLAIQELQGNKAVLVVGPGDKTMARNVTLGDRYQQFYVVTRGLEGGERVIVEGGQKVRPGMQVAPVLRPGGGAAGGGAGAPARPRAAGAGPGS